jgi:hypothetical protein
MISLAHCHRKINLRAIFDISNDPILFKNIGSLDIISKKFDTVRIDSDVKLTSSEQTIYDNILRYMSNPEQNAQLLVPKDWDALVGEYEDYSEILLSF